VTCTFNIFYFIVSPNVAVFTGCPGACRIFMRYSCRAPEQDKIDALSTFLRTKTAWHYKGPKPMWLWLL